MNYWRKRFSVTLHKAFNVKIIPKLILLYFIMVEVISSVILVLLGPLKCRPRNCANYSLLFLKLVYAMLQCFAYTEVKNCV